MVILIIVTIVMRTIMNIFIVMMFHLAEHVNEDGGDEDPSTKAEDESCAITKLVNLTRTTCPFWSKGSSALSPNKSCAFNLKYGLSQPSLLACQAIFNFNQSETMSDQSTKKPRKSKKNILWIDFYQIYLWTSSANDPDFSASCLKC